MSYTNALTASLDERTIPPCNVHQFVFSNPFSSSSPVIESLKKHVNSPIFPPIPPNKTIFHDPDSGTSVSHTFLRQTSLQLAHGIHTRYGYPKLTGSFGSGSLTGPVALVHLSNCAVWPVIVYALFAAGWTVTTTNPANTSSELAHVIVLTQPRLIISQAGPSIENAIRVACATANHSDFDLYVVDPTTGLTRQESIENKDRYWFSLLSDQELNIEPMSAEEANLRVALILWTSGTTGKPKGAMLTHRSLVASLVIVWSGMKGYKDEIFIGVPPFYHIFGFCHLVLAPPSVGSTVILARKFIPEDYLRKISKFKVTRLHFAPPAALVFAKSDLINQPWCSLKSVRFAISGGAPLAPEIIKEVYERTGIIIKLGYGMTEAGAITEAKGETWRELEATLHSTGSPLYGIETFISGTKGERNSPGEIVIRSPAQMIGYVNNQEATQEAISELGIRTGDLGYLDEEGRIVIVGRLKELIKYKGYQVSPNELEAVITTVSDVQDTAVASVYSDAQATELPLAYVVPRDSSLLQTNLRKPKISKKVLEFAHKVMAAVDRNCIHYKRLRGGIIIVSSIPKSPSGKILRGALKNLQGLHVEYHDVKVEKAKL